MSYNFMPANDAALAKHAVAYVTLNGRRIPMLHAKSFEATANVETAEVPVLGQMIKGRKATGMSLKFSMTVYKVSEDFDGIIETYKKTGVMPTFDIQVTNEDPATSMGRSTKIYHDCIIDGDVVLSMFDSEGEFIEQSISGYAMDFDSPEKYTTPSYMM